MIRLDLIPNLVETVKGYAAHEKDTLAKVIELRSDVSRAAAIHSSDGKMTIILKSNSF